MKIKSLGAPPIGAHWSYGGDYMMRISKSDAAKLLRPHHLPLMGYETEAARRVGGDSLFVQNISGHFYLCATGVTIDQWTAAFGVEVAR